MQTSTSEVKEEVSAFRNFTNTISEGFTTIKSTYSETKQQIQEN